MELASTPGFGTVHMQNNHKWKPCCQQELGEEDCICLCIVAELISALFQVWVLVEVA
jgi:hypothetical protein